ncbi:MAG TPA: TetR/AcrR family transcriptional regulator [Solirubrobacterales bacterium]|nr:TetR/AcrR family transcriptional regulator [Solirubrobacterales bacterium]
MSSEAETRKQRQERTRTELIEAAGRVFARRGYYGASVEEVAAEAGYTTGAVYSNFKGKEELFLALSDHELEKRLVDYRAVLDALDSPQGVEQAASERFGDFIRDDPDWPLLYFEFWAYGARNRKLRGEFVKQRSVEVKIIAEAIERQTAAAGVHLPLPVEQVAVGIGALINGLAFERVLDPDSVPDDLFGLIVSRLIVGLLTDLGGAEDT